MTAGDNGDTELLQYTLGGPDADSFKHIEDQRPADGPKAKLDYESQEPPTRWW